MAAVIEMGQQRMWGEGGRDVWSSDRCGGQREGVSWLCICIYTEIGGQIRWKESASIHTCMH